MANKYAAQAQEARELRTQEKACSRKKRYPTEKAAFQKGQRIYECPHCGGWHRSGAFAKFVSKLRWRSKKT